MLTDNKMQSSPLSNTTLFHSPLQTSRAHKHLAQSSDFSDKEGHWNQCGSLFDF